MAILLTVTKAGEAYEPFVLVTKEEHTGLMEFVENGIDDIISAPQQTSSEQLILHPIKTTVASTVAPTNNPQMTKVYRPEFEAWSMLSLRAVAITFTVQSPTSRKEPKIIQLLSVLYTRYRIFRLKRLLIKLESNKFSLSCLFFVRDGYYNMKDVLSN